MRLVAHASRSLDAALAMGSAALAHARAYGESVLASSQVPGPAILLGAFQRAERVVDRVQCERDGVRIVRRETSGTAAYVGNTACWFTLALPNVAGLAHDARFATLLNRNVRGFLRGFTQAGIATHYFGREWLAFERRPGALLAYAVGDDGAVLLDVIAGVESSIAIPDVLRAEPERAMDRWRGHVPVSLRECGVPDVDAIARRVADAHATKWGVELQPIELNPAEGAPARVSELDEVPPGARVHSHRCAIGYLDVACVDGRFRFGGDVLAARHTLRHFADDLARDPSAAPTLFADDALDGARPEDFLAAARDAMGAEPDAPG